MSPSFKNSNSVGILSVTTGYPETNKTQAVDFATGVPNVILRPATATDVLLAQVVDHRALVEK